MPDYKEMYFHLFHATEKAVNILLAAQRECEEIYISQPEPELKILEITFKDAATEESSCRGVFIESAKSKKR